MGDHGAGDEARALRQERDQVLHMQAVILAHAPPGDGPAHLFQLLPSGDVGVVVEVGDDDLVALRLQGRADGQADQTHERRSVHAEGHFVGVAGVDPGGDLGPRVHDNPVHLHAFGIAAAALDVEVEQVPGHCVQHDLRRLRARRIVEVDKRRRPLQRRELGTAPPSPKKCELMWARVSMAWWALGDMMLAGHE